MSEPMEVEDAVATAVDKVDTLATPFAQPIIAASKSKAQKQREYRQRIAASRTPAQAAAARKSKNERQRNNRLRQAAIASGSLEATTTSATPFAEPITAAPKTRAQIQREYRQRIAASKTPAQAAAAREARNVRDRNNRLCQAANLAIASGSLEATTTSSSRSGQRLNTVHNDTHRQFTDQQRQTLATESAETSVQRCTSDQFEAQTQSTWNTKLASSIMRFKSTLDNDFGYACSVRDGLWFRNDLKPITAALLKGKSVPGRDDDDLVDEEFYEKIINITTRVDTLEQQSKEYDKIFKEFGEMVTSHLKSLPIVSALRLHKRIEIVIEKFFSSLLDPAETNDSSHLKEFVKKKKVNTSKKGSSNKRKPSKRAPKPSSSDLTIEVIPESATTSDSKSKAQDVPFTPNRLGKPQVEYNKPVSTPLVKKSAGKRSNKSFGNNTGKTASPSSSTESDPESKPPDLTFTHDRLIKSEDDYDLSPTPLLEEDNGSSISFCIDPGSQSITVVRSAPKRKTQFYEDAASEICEPEKQARLDNCKRVLRDFK